MIKRFSRERLGQIINLPREEIKKIEEIIEILNENYGTYRECDKELGGVCTYS